MGENLIPKLAEWLGLVDGDEFEIEGSTYSPYKYIDGRFVDREGDNALVGWFGRIIMGDIEIKKLPWKPERGDRYYYVDEDGDACFDGFEYEVDVARYMMGNCFRTLDEAKAHKPEILAKIREVLG